MGRWTRESGSARFRVRVFRFAGRRAAPADRSLIIKDNISLPLEPRDLVDRRSNAAWRPAGARVPGTDVRPGLAKPAPVTVS